MSKPSNGPSSLSEAIEKLEGASSSKSQDMKEILEKDYQKIHQALQELKPYLENVKEKVDTEVRKAKGQVENQVKENPWMALGIVGLFAFIIGLILGNSRK